MAHDLLGHIRTTRLCATAETGDKHPKRVAVVDLSPAAVERMTETLTETTYNRAWGDRRLHRELSLMALTALFGKLPAARKPRIRA